MIYIYHKNINFLIKKLYYLIKKNNNSTDYEYFNLFFY